jgi:predicted nicotinamide N-methyase
MPDSNTGQAIPAPRLPVGSAEATMPERNTGQAIPAPRLPVGSAEATMFFDHYPRFGTRKMQMNLRYEAIIRQNQDAFSGARVLDLACSEGAWSFSALDAGAVHVIGIESREKKVNNARQHFAHYGVASDRYQLVAGDVFDVLADEPPQVDVVLCLGFLYHTLRYPELMHCIRATGAKSLILDTEVMVEDEPHVHLIAENVDVDSNASQDRYSVETTVLSGRPSLAAIEKMLAVYGFAIERRSDWAAIFRDNAGMRFREYAQGRRVTLLCRRRDNMSWRDGGSRREPLRQGDALRVMLQDSALMHDRTLLEFACLPPDSDYFRLADSLVPTVEPRRDVSPGQPSPRRRDE